MPTAEMLQMLLNSGLNTIIDYDKVVVLERGHLKQFGPPAKLLDDKAGIFFNLVEE